MTPERTYGSRGSYRFDEVIPSVGRLRIKSGARTKHEHQRRVALVRKLRDDKGRLDLLQALHEGTLTIVELLDADRRDALPQVAGDLAGRRALWPAVTQALEAMESGPSTIRRYRMSWQKLQASGLVPADLTVGQLAQVDWRALNDAWASSAADWNHLRRAVSRTLTVLLGSRWHPLRAAVLAKFPTRVERARMPDLSPAEFQRALAKVPPPIQPFLMTIAITGLRVGELFRLRPEHLGRHVLSVPGHADRRRRTKGDGVERRIPVDAALWPWVKAAVPCMVSDRTIREHWYRALTASKLPRVRLHDLRHCTAQWLANAGRPLTSLQALLGHATIEMTARYARRRALAEDATAMAGILVPAAPKAPSRRAGRR